MFQVISYTEANMSKKSKENAKPVEAEVRIYSATCGSLGRVIRGKVISEAEAVVERKAGRDVVVCDSDGRANRETAQRIENAVGPNKREDPHEKAGPYALPHFQPEPRPPAGHTFYETRVKKAAKNS